MGSKKALFAPDDVPPGGTCLSSFVVVRYGHKILVGKMSKPDAWIERFFVGPKFAPVYAGSGKYVIPARHLAWYESPLEAARGVVRDQIQVKAHEPKLKLLDAQSHVRGDPSSTSEPPHWDICFVYRLELTRAQARALNTPQWFSELTFRRPSELGPQDFTRGHGDVLALAGVIKDRPAK